MIEKFLALVNGLKLTGITTTILVDFLLGVILALKKREFEFQKLADFVLNMLGYLGGYFSAGVLAVVNSKYEILVPGIFTIIEVSLASSVLAKLKELGLKKIPERLAR